MPKIKEIRVIPSKKKEIEKTEEESSEVDDLEEITAESELQDFSEFMTGSSRAASPIIQASGSQSQQSIRSFSATSQNEDVSTGRAPVYEEAQGGRGYIAANLNEEEGPVYMGAEERIASTRSSSRLASPIIRPESTVSDITSPSLQQGPISGRFSESPGASSDSRPDTRYELQEEGKELKVRRDSGRM